jgi:aminoglycoside phosphotransferase (APT) family kinase protein
VTTEPRGIPGGPAPVDERIVLDPGWLTAVLEARHPGTVVAATTVSERLETVATKLRFRVDYDANPSGAPDALCVKGFFNPATHQMMAALHTEPLFYRDVAPHLTVRTPPCVHVGIDDGTGHGLIVMVDMVDAGAAFHDPLADLTVDQAAATLDQFAELHATYWARLPDAVSAAFPPRLVSLAGRFDTPTLQSMLDDGRAAAVPPADRQASRVQGAMHALSRLTPDHPQCLVHGDVHTGNLYHLPDGRPGLIDWQVAQCGTWALDIAYHLATVLDPDERTRSERDLLDHYLDRLAVLGVDPPGRDDAWWLYRAHLPYGYYMWSITRAVVRPVIEHRTTRLGQAVSQHRSLDLLGV